jgi:hypothetical protein
MTDFEKAYESVERMLFGNNENRSAEDLRTQIGKMWSQSSLYLGMIRQMVSDPEYLSLVRNGIESNNLDTASQKLWSIWNGH